MVMLDQIISQKLFCISEQDMRMALEVLRMEMIHMILK